MVLSPKVKLLYLIFLNLFLIGIFIYLLDVWGLIQLNQYLPFMEKEPPKVDQTQANALLLEKEKLEKEKQIIEEEKIKINELKLKIDEQQKALQEKEKELQEEKQNIEKQKQKLQEIENARKERNKMIEDMAKRLNAMPPEDVIAIIQGWKNIDIVDVFLKMEELAEEEGSQSIVPYLLSQLPPERASVITSLMLDEGIRENIFQE
ncbi:MAG: flagellar protein FlbB [Leptospiraceae bacterium]|nr:MAG: flagellar protein FlbB [Leptospiraceae bacterium]